MTSRRNPSSILAFFGVATLIAGVANDIDTGCLTDPDKCTIILSRNTPAGTLGFLTAPTSGRGASSTNFDIVSTSNTETSTVNWMAIPKDVGLGASTTFTNNASLRRGPSGINVQKGRATLVAGTKSVTGIPFGADAKLFVMARTFAGTPGKLSAPVASVNPATGTFVLNSSSSSDTSEVQWVVVDQPLRFSQSGPVFSQSKGAISGTTEFSNMNPLLDPGMIVLASVITASSPDLLSGSAPVTTLTDGSIIIVSNGGGDGSLIEVVSF